MLHDLRLGVHTPDFLDSEEGEGTWQFRGMAGIVQMPESPIVGVDGGTRPSARVEATYGYDGSVFSNIELSLKYNDPVVLALFPYAENALNIYFLLQFGQE